MGTGVMAGPPPAHTRGGHFLAHGDAAALIMGVFLAVSHCPGRYQGS